MLTREACNALLKTLEEPPAHVIFILATTEVHKLPETVVSRCQTFSFQKPSLRDLQSVLTKIAAAEGWKLEPAAAELLALLGEGSFRDAIGVLQQVGGAAVGGQITAELVEQVTGAPSATLLRNFLTALLAKDLPAALKEVEQLTPQAVAVSLFLKLVLRIARATLLIKLAPDLQTNLLAGLTPEEQEFITSLTKHTGATELPKIIRELLAAYDEITTTYLPTLPLELALVRIMGQTIS